ncbi:hypothetical protein [Aeromonas jandaei]|uniref:hypothetical protein n=1 Tax=Aeromonas jandaei TaxID=650 RepID=UPI003BA205A3
MTNKKHLHRNLTVGSSILSANQGKTFNMFKPSTSNLKNTLIIPIVISTLSFPASALSIKEYAAIYNNESNLSTYNQKVMYLNGIADTFNTLKMNTDKIFIFNNPQFCTPRSFSFDAAFLDGVINKEINKKEFWRSTLGEEWDSYPPAFFVTMRLKERFPCKEK